MSKRGSQEPVKMKYKYILGKKFLISKYHDCDSCFTSFLNKYSLIIAWTNKRGDFWYSKEPHDKGFIWCSKSEVKLNEHETAKSYRLHVGRLAIAFGTKTK